MRKGGRKKWKPETLASPVTKYTASIFHPVQSQAPISQITRQVLPSYLEVICAGGGGGGMSNKDVGGAVFGEEEEVVGAADSMFFSGTTQNYISK